MRKNVMIYNELKELNSPLADISNKNVFTVPEGYFDSLPADILHGIKAQYTMEDLDIPALDMKVPENYFDGLANEIMSKIKANEIPPALEETYPGWLISLRHKNVFKVPDGYFDSLAENIVSKIEKQPAKVIELKPRSSFFKYAVAATITGLIGLSLFSILDKRSENNITANVTFNITDKAKEILKNNSFDNMMDALNEDEIISYLKSEGDDVNAALVASLTDEKSLPSEDMYFTDEKTLDNFLVDQHINESIKN